MYDKILCIILLLNIFNCPNKNKYNTIDTCVLKCSKYCRYVFQIHYLIFSR